MVVFEVRKDHFLCVISKLVDNNILQKYSTVLKLS